MVTHHHRPDRLLVLKRVLPGDVPLVYAVNVEIIATVAIRVLEKHGETVGREFPPRNKFRRVPGVTFPNREALVVEWIRVFHNDSVLENHSEVRWRYHC